MVTPHASESSGSEDRSLRYDVTVLRVFCVWIFLQCFFYNAIPSLRWNIGLIVTPDRLAFVVLVLVVGRQLAKSRSVRNQNGRASKAVGWSAVVFGIVAMVSWLVHDFDFDISGRLGTLTWILNLSLFPMFAFFVARRLRYTRRMLNEFLTVFALLGLYLAVTAIGEHYGISGLVFPKYILDPTVGTHFGRSRGPFVDTINNGGMLSLCFLACGCLSASFTGLKRLSAFVLALLIVPAIYFTDTRGVWLSLAAIIGTFLLLRSPLRRAGASLAAILALAFLTGIGSKFSAFDNTLFSRRQRTVDYRLDNYQLAWDAFKANPVFGLGYAKLMFEWRDFDSGHSRLGEGVSGGNHNTVLGLLAELGLTGTIPYVGMILGATFVCFRAYRAFQDPKFAFERQCAVIALAAIEIIVVLGLTNDLKAMPAINIVAFWLVGAISSVDSAWRAARAGETDGRGAMLPRRSRFFGAGRGRSALHASSF